MDAPRDFHTEWSKSDREREIYDIAYMWKLKRNDKNEHTHKTETDLENELTVTSGRRVEGRDS